MASWLSRIVLASLAGLVLIGQSMAAPITETKPTINGKCTEFFFPITASASNFNLDNVPENLQDPVVLEDFIISTASAIAGTGAAKIGRLEANGTFSMSAIYCVPNKVGAGRNNTIQYLQHAITMRKEYFNGLTYPQGFEGLEYSYIETLLNNGYYLIAVDNLGAGKSAHPDPTFVAQQTLQVAVIHEILQKLRAGTVGGPVGTKAFDTVIYTGHSYGSICGNGIATHYPSDVDAFVFTGYTGEFVLGAGPLGSGILVPASTVHPRFAGLQAGYLAMSSELGRSEALYTSPNSLGGFNKLLPFYDFEYEDTGSIGEIGTLLYGVGPADSFTGHVLTVTGERDAIVCNVPPTPNCGSGATSLPARAGNFFPNAKDCSYYIPADTGHDVFLHLSSPATFRHIMEYLLGKGY